MTNREFFLKTHAHEGKAFVAVLKAVNQDRSGYKPDPKARTGGELAWAIAHEEEMLAQVLGAGRAEWTDPKPPATVAESVATYERAAAAVDEVVKGLDDAAWDAKVTIVMGGAPWEESRLRMAWGFLLDAIHHRGQLSTYLRPMGGKVPEIYGPTADSQK